MKKVVLVNESKNDRVEVKTGYSFRTLLLWFLDPLFREDITGFLVMGGYALLVALFRATFPTLPYGLLGLVVFPAVYNKFYIRKLMDEGYEPDCCEEALEELKSYISL